MIDLKLQPHNPSVCVASLASLRHDYCEISNFELSGVEYTVINYSCPACCGSADIYHKEKSSAKDFILP